MQFNEIKNKNFLTRHFHQEPGFDPSWGRCCCYYGNRRGSRCIQFYDMLLSTNLIIKSLAWVAYCHDKDLERKAFKNYANYRRKLFWLFSPLIALTVLALIILDVLTQNGSHYIISIIVSLITTLVIYIDWHWSSVLWFNANYP